MSRFLTIGHRGAMGYEPENTLRSFRRALALGVDAIELDVYNVEGTLVVFHDDRLERTTNGIGYLAGKTLAEIRALDAGEGERIPFLHEVLDLVAGRVAINIELKGWGTARPTAELITTYLTKPEWTPKHFLVSSFKHAELRDFRTERSDVPIGALIEAAPIDHARFAAELNAYSVHVALDHVTEAFVHDARSRNLKVFVYSVNHSEDFTKARMLGVDGVFTNLPDRKPSTDAEHPHSPGW